MRCLNKKNVFLYSLILLFLVGRVFLFKGIPIAKYINLINPLFWLFMAIISYLFSKNSNSIRKRKKYDIIQSIIIVMIIYCMVYFSLGLLFGYEKSPYSHEFGSILKNIWSFITIIIFQEYTRYNLLKTSSKKVGNYFLIIILFVISNIDFWSFSSNFTTNADIFKYVSQVFLPLFVSNCLFTYLCIISGNIPSTIYRCVIEFMVILLPIFPSLNWLVKSMIDIILVIIVVLYINYIDVKSSRLMSRREVKKENFISYIPFICLLVIMVCFIGGMFKFQPIAVLSNSMYPTFSRGDSVVIKKLSKNELGNLKKNDILYFSKNGIVIIHRIVSISFNENGKVEIITKGDNNNSNDNWVVSDEEIIGKKVLIIPFIGYPSVIVNEILEK